MYDRFIVNLKVKPSYECLGVSFNFTCASSHTHARVCAHTRTHIHTHTHIQYGQFIDNGKIHNKNE